MKKIIKIYGMHPFCKDVPSLLKYLKIESLNDLFDFQWSPTGPDYLIATEHIIYNPKYLKEFQRLNTKAKILIYMAGEAVSPDFNVFDYATGFDGNLVNGDRFVQIPPPFSFFDGFLRRDENEISTKEEAMAALKEKKGFCNFLYSNWNAHPRRDELFHLLSSYKRVDSLGKHMNNVGKLGTGFVGHALDCIDIKSPYKFSIASENATFLGYTSEKIITSLEAHTVPIYWGDPEIARNINPKCFINSNGLSDEQVLERVKEVDNNDTLWAEMVAQPWRTEEQKELHKERMIHYVSFFRHIFEQDITDAVRRPIGTWPEQAQYFFMNSNIKKISYYSRGINKMSKCLSLLKYRLKK